MKEARTSDTRYQCSECDMAHETARDELLCCNPVMGTGEPGNRQVGGVHYTAMPVQPWTVIDTWPREQAIGYYRGNALKYLLRAGSKGDAGEDIRKAEHYCAKLATVMATMMAGDD